MNLSPVTMSKKGKVFDCQKIVRKAGGGRESALQKMFQKKKTSAAKVVERGPPRQRAYGKKRNILNKKGDCGERKKKGTPMGQGNFQGVR